MDNFWKKMQHSPEGKVISGQEKARSGKRPIELMPTYERQAVNDLDEHAEYGKLINDIASRLEDLVEDGHEEREEAARDLAIKHEGLLKNHKGIENINEQIAYILALAKEQAKRRGELH